MSKRMVWCMAATLVLTATLFSQEKSDKKQKKNWEGQDWMKLTMPNEHHQQLSALAGKWNLVVKQPIGDGKFSEAKGTSTFHWAMGNRFLIEEVKTDLDGHPFEWMGIHGYDNIKKKNVSAWIDNLGTSIDRMEGSFDGSGKVLTYIGDFDEFNGVQVKAKWIIKIESNDRVVTEMYEVGKDGKETKPMEIIASRAQ